MWFHIVSAFFAVVFTLIYGPPALPSTVGRRFFLPDDEKPTPSTVACASTYVIPIDNSWTHKHSRVKEWLAVRPRFHLHVTPTYASWINQVERFFGIMTQKAIRGGFFPKVGDLTRKINAFVEQDNAQARPCMGVASVSSWK